MCQTIVIEDGPVIQSFGQLRRFFADSPIVLTGGASGLVAGDALDRFCLCAVNIEATAAHAGYSVVENDGDPMEYTLRRRKPRNVNCSAVGDW